MRLPLPRVTEYGRDRQSRSEAYVARQLVALAQLALDHGVTEQELLDVVNKHRTDYLNEPVAVALEESKR